MSNGIFFYGEKGTLFVTDDRWVVIPKDKNKQREEHKATADLGTAHMAEFLSAVRSRKQPGCTIEDGYRSTATVKLAMIAYDVGAKIAWDEKSATDRRQPQGGGIAEAAVPCPLETPVSDEAACAGHVAPHRHALRTGYTGKETRMTGRQRTGTVLSRVPRACS